MIKHCKYHCAVCDAHFTSLAGFDAHHRVVTGKNEKDAKTRYTTCMMAPSNTDKTEWVQIEGVCDLTKGLIGKRVPAGIWKNAKEDARFKQKPSEGLNLITKGISPLEAKDPSESEWESPSETVVTLNRCRVCSKVIPATGRRGRPRVIHEECK